MNRLGNWLGRFFFFFAQGVGRFRSFFRGLHTDIYQVGVIRVGNSEIKTDRTKASRFPFSIGKTRRKKTDKRFFVFRFTTLGYVT